MNIVNDDTITKILSFDNHPSTFKVTSWDIESKIIPPGQNSTSEVYRLTINYLKNDKNLVRIVFVKVPCNAPTYEILKTMSIYDKEPYLYSKLFPQIYSMGEEHFAPINYYTDDKQSLFLKDLSQSGYKMLSLSEKLDFEHSYYAIRCLARWHAHTVKLDQSNAIPDFVKKDKFYRSSNTLPLVNSLIQGLEPFINNLKPDIKQKYAKQVGILEGIDWNKIVDDSAPKPNSFNVLLHGDFAPVNMMFKYDKYGNVKKVKLIDFQTSRWTSPAIDLIYFMVLTMDYQVYEKYGDLLLRIYSDTLNKILRGLGCEPYEFERMKRDIERRYMWAFAMIASLLPIRLIDFRKTSINLNELFETGHLQSTLIDKAYNNKNYIEIANKWFLEYAQKGIFDSRVE